VGLSISASACGRCHACACVFMCICMRMHICVGIYICAFFCSECCLHFTGVLGTSTWAGVYVAQMCFYTNVHICEHTRCRFSICAYVCICMRMCMSVHVCVYRCMCICKYMYICMFVYMYAYTFMYARVWVYICTRVGAFCLCILSNLS